MIKPTVIMLVSRHSEQLGTGEEIHSRLMHSFMPFFSPCLRLLTDIFYVLSFLRNVGKPVFKRSLCMFHSDLYAVHFGWAIKMSRISSVQVTCNLAQLSLTFFVCHGSLFGFLCTQNLVKHSCMLLARSRFAGCLTVQGKWWSTVVKQLCKSL